MKKIGFLTGTRADYGKLKPLIKAIKPDGNFEIHLLVTGMHLLDQYGSTVAHVIDDHLGIIHLLPNQHPRQNMETCLARTIEQISETCSDNDFDLLVVHGDRIEALAGAIVGVLRNIPVAHIEGGEVSGTVDGLIRHSVSKLSHLHFVSNKKAQKRLEQLGEKTSSIYEIGSPDIDAMLFSQLPSVSEVKTRYNIDFEEYAVLIFHPVTNEIEFLNQIMEEITKSLEHSGHKFIIIKPNNDLGTHIVQKALSTLSDRNRYLHIPSMRFEFFLQLLKNAKYIIGNSSAGVREAAYFGVPAINIGTRQLNRNENELILNTGYDKEEILESILATENIERMPKQDFGDGKSGIKFAQILNSESFWPVDTNKVFVDVSK
ncbi:UDP-N-acetylglucosamine 2-epimerase (hydrolysing) [Candidatus Planktophila sulfonica]|uniref:UDP-N-acetylglucosamine 2-epimerase (Hydrolysing) n=1 Tax=Candidatus Planktophila sulfonica TaxID=1884904 RepID=A0A249KF82_9ACTN|nr:UDP-N-acetylglucosamine 2-epimerase [Candidatus Planktophila sulfonica]ASY15355.1 UDP-N-acetylglucosamine 2-epimerase (hydrolysing) [Candidatus Planktophila sulfonica]